MTPDINGLSARTRYHELLLSLNDTAQAPDDPSQTPQGGSRDLIRFITPFNQVLPRFSTNSYIQLLRSPIVPPSKSISTLSRIQKTPNNQGFWRSVVDILVFGTRFVRQDLGVKSGGFGSGSLYRGWWLDDTSQTPQDVSRDLVRFIMPFNQVLPRFSTNYYIIQPLRSPILPPSKSISTLSRIQKTPNNQGFWRSVVDILCFGTRFVRQDLDGVKSGGFGSGFLYRVCWFNVFR